MPSTSQSKWAQPFSEAGVAPFEGAGEVPMMRVEGRFDYAEDAIRLPYRDSDLRFVATLGAVRGVRGRTGRARSSCRASPRPRRWTWARRWSRSASGRRSCPARELEHLVSGPGEKALGRVLQRARVDVDEQGTRPRPRPP